jgi:hypothetical protein
MKKHNLTYNSNDFALELISDGDVFKCFWTFLFAITPEAYRYFKTYIINKYLGHPFSWRCVEEIAEMS